MSLFLIGFFALYAHLHERGFDSIDSGNQVKRHEARLVGESDYFNPWQYRILSTWVVEAQVFVYQKVGVAPERV